MKLFFETFLLIFVAEMGDKSQLLSLAFASKYKMSVVLKGVFLGIVLNHGLAIGFSSILSNYIDLDVIRFLASIVFLVFGVGSLLMDFDEEDEDSAVSKYGPVITIASTFFIGELGDKTQILAMTMGAMSDQKLLILFATVSSMVLVSVIGILVGRGLNKKLPERTLKVIASFLFLFFGLSGMREKGGTYLLFSIVFVLVGIFLVSYINKKRKDEYYVGRIMDNLKNCLNCKEEYCDCKTKREIEDLSKSYLGEDVIYLGSIINYLERSKEISPEKYRKLYDEVMAKKWDLSRREDI